jgi:hypothetical protein
MVGCPLNTRLTEWVVVREMITLRATSFLADKAATSR